MDMSFKDLIDECLFNKKPKKKKKKIVPKTEDAMIPTPQDFGTMALARKATKKKKKPEDSKTKEQIETAVKTNNNKKPTYEDIIEQTKTEKRGKQEVELQEIRQLADNMSHMLPEDAMTKQDIWRHFWWVKDNNHYGLATFATRAELLARAPVAQTSTDVPQTTSAKAYQSLYQKPLLIKWLITKEEITDAGHKNYFDYVSKNKLLVKVSLAKGAIKAINSQLMGFISRNVGDKDPIEWTEEEQERVAEIEEQVIDTMEELPIQFDNKKLNNAEVAKVKSFMAKGYSKEAKFTEANVGTVIKEADLPKAQDMARKAL